MAEQLHLQFPSVKVIIMSVHEEPEYRRLARRVGALDFVSKPQFTVEKIYEILSSKEWLL